MHMQYATYYVLFININYYIVFLNHLSPLSYIVQREGIKKERDKLQIENYLNTYID